MPQDIYLQYITNLTVSLVTRASQWFNAVSGFPDA